MKAAWLAIVARYAARTRRERLLIAALLVIGLPLVGLSLWVEPAWRTHRALQAELATLNRESAGRGDHAPIDPNAAARLELANLQAQLAQDQRAVTDLSRALVSPAEMVALLERLLARHPGVRLMAMRSLPGEPWQGRVPGAGAGGPSQASTAAAPANSGPAAAPGSPPASQAAALYRHGVELELEGGWGALRAYLADIEQSPRRLQWGQLQLSAQEHPRSRMKITLHTLSLEAAWLQL